MPSGALAWDGMVLAAVAQRSMPTFPIVPLTGPARTARQVLTRWVHRVILLVAAAVRAAAISGVRTALR